MLRHSFDIRPSPFVIPATWVLGKARDKQARAQVIGRFPGTGQPPRALMVHADQKRRGSITDAYAKSEVSDPAQMSGLRPVLLEEAVRLLAGSVFSVTT